MCKYPYKWNVNARKWKFDSGNHLSYIGIPPYSLLLNSFPQNELRQQSHQKGSLCSLTIYIPPYSNSNSAYIRFFISAFCMASNYKYYLSDRKSVCETHCKHVSKLLGQLCINSFRVCGYSAKVTHCVRVTYDQSKFYDIIHSSSIKKAFMNTNYALCQWTEQSALRYQPMDWCNECHSYQHSL